MQTTTSNNFTTEKIYLKRAQLVINANGAKRTRHTESNLHHEVSSERKSGKKRPPAEVAL